MAALLIPSTIIDGLVFIQGQSLYLIGVADVVLPKEKHIKTSLQGFGLGGKREVAVQGHYEDQIVTLTFNTVTPDAYTVGSQFGQQIEIRTAIQFHDTGAGAMTPIPARYVINVLPSERDWGKIQPGEKQDMKVELTCVNYVVYYNDVLVRQIDFFNNKDNTNGNDSSAAINQMIGRTG
jgi:P2 family phage contractile tail tube protein